MTLTVLVCAALLAATALAWSLHRDSRALHNGYVAALATCLLLGVLTAGVELLPRGHQAVDLVRAVVVLLVGAGMLALPALLILDGVLMVRRERRSVANALALATGAVQVGSLVVVVLLVREGSAPSNAVALTLVLVQGWVSLLFLGFALQTVLYGVLARRAAANAVIVLGGGLVEGRVPPLLAARLRRAIEAADGVARHDRTGAAPVIVPSGGQGADEPRPEGVAMAEWLREHGVPGERILVEDRATTTRENLRLSAELLRDNGVPGPYVVVTNNYHAPRAALLARALGIDAHAVGAPTALYYWPSAYLREFVAVVLEHRALVVLTALVALTGTILGWRLTV